MGHKVNPISLRLGYTKGWDANWYAGKREYADRLLEDERIRQYVLQRMARGGASKIAIERTLKRVTVSIHTARPGMFIGKAGAEVDKLREELKKITKKEVNLNVLEIKRPELDAYLVAENIAQQLRNRSSHKRAMKLAIAAAVRSGAEGIKVKVSGRLGGVDIARSEEYKEGRIPLHTLRANIDYASSYALTVYGKIGVKVWIYKGELFPTPQGVRAVAETAPSKGTSARADAARRSGPQRRTRAKASAS